MKIVIDNKIPFIQGVLEPLAEVVYTNGSDIDAALVKDADALIVRTRTMCDASLLRGSRVRFIATATIGYDHIDTDYCAINDIVWTNAPGCNAYAVVQYVFASLGYLSQRDGFDLTTKTIGIVGVGNVGRRVALFAERLGMRVLLNDPPRAELEDQADFVSLAEIQAQSDIITFHTPLAREGNYPTFHLCDTAFLKEVKENVIIINASRGEVCDGMALHQHVTQLGALVIDCWENEPQIDLDLLQVTDIATFHIAGYSLEGKANATSASVRSLSQFFALGMDDWQVELPLNEKPCSEDLSPLDQVVCSYPIMNDVHALKSHPASFEALRGKYEFRREPQIIY